MLFRSEEATKLRLSQKQIINGRFRKFKEEDWRVLLYRKRVGSGRDCYERVRNAALDWEFLSSDGSMGMMEVPVSCHSDRQSHIISTPKQRYSIESMDESNSGSPSPYRSLGSRRLVSFTSKRIAGFLPSRLQKRIYALNPVMVVYDIVDERAPSTTFTSTAYATLKVCFNACCHNHIVSTTIEF